MTIYREAWLIGAILLNLGLAGAVSAQGPDGMDGGPWAAHREQYVNERLAQIHTELKLTPAQEADWKTFSDKIERARAQKIHPDIEAMQKLSAPDRLQKLIDLNKARQTMLEDVLAATRTFYATLSPEQRKAFDELTPMGERAPRGRRGGAGRPGAPK